MNHKARSTIEEFSMLKQGDTVIAAVSGGADSVALLDFLCSLLDLRLNVRACHLNHCLRGAESDRDERLVRTMCEQYGVPLDVSRVDVKVAARRSGLSIETAAREERYAFFDTLCAKYGAKVATAHTLSDTAETVLFNLARGTGIAGLCGIPPTRGQIIRPLIACSRAEIEDYCAAHDLYFVNDSSNLSDDYTRNHIRHNVIPQLCRVNPDVQGAIGRMTETLLWDADFLTEAASRAAETLSRAGGWDAAMLHELHPALRSRIIAARLGEVGVERSADRVALIERMLAEGKPRVVQLAGNEYVSVSDGVLRFEHREKKNIAPNQPLVVRKTALDGAVFSLGCGKCVTFSVVKCEDYEVFKNNSKLVLKNAADYDKISGDILIRARQAGDRLRPAGRGCSKSLKKLYNELALAARERLCVIADGDGVLFAEGAGVDERVKPDPATKTVLTFTITEQKAEEQGYEK